MSTQVQIKCVFFILFKPTHALFLKHIHIHIWNSKLLKMFVKKHQLKPYMFRSQLFDQLQGVVFRA